MKKVLLLYMPLARRHLPSMNLGILKPLVNRAGIECDVVYLNHLFGAIAGGETYDSAYDEVSKGNGSFALLEWVFAESLFGDRAKPESADVDRLLGDGSWSPGFRTALTALRRAAGAFLDRCMATVPWEEYAVAGFTVYHPQLNASLALACRIRERHPDIKIAMGGLSLLGGAGTALMRLFPFIDWVFNGEADLSFPEALKALRAGMEPEGIPGVSFRRGGDIVEQGLGESIDLKDLPRFDYRDFFDSLEAWAPEILEEDGVILLYMFSRGCWWAERSKCVFCGIPDHLVRFRCKEPSEILDELRSLKRSHRFGKVNIYDNVIPDFFYDDVLPVMAGELGIDTVQIEVRPNDMTDDHLKSVGAGRVMCPLAGVDSLDSECLRLLRKGTNLLGVLEFLKRSREFDVGIIWAFLYGIPGETPEAYLRIAELVASISHLPPPHTHAPLQVLRFSPMFEEYGKSGPSALRPIRPYRVIYPFGEDDLREIAAAFESSWRENEPARRAIRVCLTAIEGWAASWNDGPKPMLAHHVLPDGRLAVFDTRPSSEGFKRVLDVRTARAYLTCRTPASFPEIRRAVEKATGGGRSDGREAEEVMEELLNSRLAVRDGNRYLSLGTDLEVMKDYCNDIQVQLLAAGL